jgi:hypothetical protein
VAGVTGLIQRRPGQQLVAYRAMRLMAVAASDLTETHRMRVRLGKFGALTEVAGIADLGLCLYFEYRVWGGVQLVTTGAGNIGRLVRAAFPANMIVALVAVGTHTVLLRNRYLRCRAEGDNRGAFIAGPDAAGMTALFDHFGHRFRARDAGAVASLTLQAGKRRALVALLRVLCFEDIEYRVYVVLVVALDAGVSPFLGIGSRLDCRPDIDVVLIDLVGRAGAASDGHAYESQQQQR